MKGNNGNPCSDSSSRKNTGRCVHAAIVAAYPYLYDRSQSGVGGEVEVEADSDMDGMEIRPEEGV